MGRLCQVNFPDPPSLVIIYVRIAIAYQQCVQLKGRQPVVWPRMNREEGSLRLPLCDIPTGPGKRISHVEAKRVINRRGGTESPNGLHQG